MKRHLIAVALASALGALAVAQWIQIHVTSDGTVTGKFEGGNWSSEPDRDEGQPAQRHLFDDAELHAPPAAPWSTPQVTFAEPWPGFALPLPPFSELTAPDPALPWVKHPSRFVFDAVENERVRSEYVARFEALTESSLHGFSAAPVLGAAVDRRPRAPGRPEQSA